MTEFQKIAKMKALTEPIVGELLEVVRLFKKDVQSMRDMTDFKECREILSIVVNLRNLLDAQRK
jgi:hypothetical protein